MAVNHAEDIGLDILDLVIARGKQRNVYDRDAERQDQGALVVVLGNLWRRLRLSVCAGFGAMGSFIWLYADTWTIPGSLLGSAGGISAVVFLAVSALRALGPSGGGLNVPPAATVQLHKWWREQTEIEDSLLADVAAATDTDTDAADMSPPGTLSAPLRSGKPSTSH